MNYKERMAFDWIMSAAAMFMVYLRLWAHGRKQRTTHAIVGDILVVFSLTLYLVAVSTISYKNYIFTKNPMAISSRSFLAMGFMQGFVYVWGLWMTKATFICLYFSLSKHMGQVSRNLLYVTATFLAISLLLNTILDFLWCRPFSKVLNAKSFCNPQFALVPQAVLTATNMASDLLLTALGITVVNALKMSRRQKIAVSFVVVVGFIPVIATAARFARIYGVVTGGKLTHEILSGLEAWTIVDWTFAMHAACLPALRVFLRNALGKEGKVFAGEDTMGRFFSAGTLSRALFSRGSRNDSVASHQNSVHERYTGHSSIHKSVVHEEDQTELIPVRIR